MIVITQHVIKRRDALTADCRPPASADEGSVNPSRYHHPASEAGYTHHERHGGIIFIKKETAHIYELPQIVRTAQKRTLW